VIDQIQTEPYPPQSITINCKIIHSKKYFYENVLVNVTGDYKIEKNNRLDVDH
jgi:hypothetical protein